MLYTYSGYVHKRKLFSSKVSNHKNAIFLFHQINPPGIIKENKYIYIHIYTTCIKHLKLMGEKKTKTKTSVNPVATAVVFFKKPRRLMIRSRSSLSFIVCHTV